MYHCTYTHYMYRWLYILSQHIPYSLCAVLRVWISSITHSAWHGFIITTATVYNVCILYMYMQFYCLNCYYTHTSTTAHTHTCILYVPLTTYLNTEIYTLQVPLTVCRRGSPLVLRLQENMWDLLSSRRAGPDNSQTAHRHSPGPAQSLHGQGSSVSHYSTHTTSISGWSCLQL